MSTCKACHATIRMQRVWPSGSWEWYDTSVTMCGAFCSERDGEPHAPALSVADEASAFLAALP